MSPQEALETVGTWIDDATSIIETLEYLGDEDRPIADEDYPLDEAWKVLEGLVPDA